MLNSRIIKLYVVIAKKDSEYMRVITGLAKGRRLQSPVGNDVRPTTDVVKEAVFSIIQFSVEGSRFLDAFAGSGQMGIEALSRGAEKAYFIDSSRRSMNIIKNNIKLCNFESSAETVTADTLSYLSRTTEKFDIIFLDPPYQTGLLQAALEKVPELLSEKGIVICEHPKEEELPETVGKLTLGKKYRYGKIVISAYIKV